MVLLTQSLKKWLWDNHSDLLPLILLGHVELFTEDMAHRYIEWCRTEEGRQYLKGGSKYEDSEQNRMVEDALRETETAGDTNAGRNAEHCVCCGEVIPEGRQVCPKCGK